MSQKIFDLEPETEAIVIKNGFYQGHFLLCRWLDYLKRVSGPTFPFTRDDKDLRARLEKLFWESLDREFLIAQKELAEKYLIGKEIKLFSFSDKTLEFVRVVRVHLSNDGDISLFRLGFNLVSSTVVVDQNVRIQICR